ncbi:Serine/threonine-protein phosphatase 7 long form-like [Vitis vinifera]|uniref:Serine/threonine-protein phosphatase 7 long form-like n=1 Tax=Vitis vinifera TaxID=29760 RepID=A0A438DJB7_VITVI|nr:Serine/threonine-protein phosphatase 7 long form-like [Vitis vinifera]
MNVLAQYRHHLDRLTPDQQFGFRQGIPQPCHNESILHKCDLRSRHDVDWSTRYKNYIQRWTSKREHIARGKMAIGSLGYHDPYMVWYCSITIQFLTQIGSFHELLTTSIHQRYDTAAPNDLHICRLCTTVLEAIHEMNRLDAPFSVDVTTQPQPQSGHVRPIGRGPGMRKIRHTPVVA